MSQRTKLLFEERRRNFNKLSEQDRRESTRAIAVSSRDDFRFYVHKVLDDIEEAESVGNMRSVTKLTRILAHKDRRTSCNPSKGADGRLITTTAQLLKPGTHHAIFVFCWTQRRRKDDCRMVCAHQRRSSSVDFTNATVVGPIRKTNRSNNCCMVCAGQRHMSHQPTGHRPITVKHFRDA